MTSPVKYSPPASPGAELYNGGQTNPLSYSFTPTMNRSTSASSSVADRPQSPTRLTADAKRNKYLRRLFKFRQMDFEYAFWQMLYLLISPQKV
jgi:UNC-50 family